MIENLPDNGYLAPLLLVVGVSDPDGTRHHLPYLGHNFAAIERLAGTVRDPAYFRDGWRISSAWLARDVVQIPVPLR